MVTNPFKGKRVLEIGCGVGALAIELAAYYDPDLVVGCDIDPASIKQAGKNVRKVQRSFATKTMIDQFVESQKDENREMLNHKQSQQQ